jgi:hypothetical protein
VDKMLLTVRLPSPGFGHRNYSYHMQPDELSNEFWYGANHLLRLKKKRDVNRILGFGGKWCSCMIG